MCAKSYEVSDAEAATLREWNMADIALYAEVDRRLTAALAPLATTQAPLLASGMPSGGVGDIKSAVPERGNKFLAFIHV